MKETHLSQNDEVGVSSAAPSGPLVNKIFTGNEGNTFILVNKYLQAMKETHSHHIFIYSYIVLGMLERNSQLVREESFSN